MKNTRIYKIYAKIFFDKAKSEKVLTDVIEDFKSFSSILFQNDRLERFFVSNICSFDDKLKVLSLCKFAPMSMHFLQVLLSNTKISYLSDIYDEMINLKILSEGMKRAILLSASEMSDKEIDECRLILEKKLKEKFVIDHKVDNSIIGGVVLKFGTMMYDASVRNQLQKLKETRV